MADRNGLELRQSYRRILKELSYDHRFRNHPRNKGKARKADKKVRTIAGRFVRDVERKLGTGVDVYRDELELYKRVLVQKKKDKNKIYSLHEGDVQCISKGKEHKQYEFGNKVSITRTGTGVIVGALSFRNEFDGHTLDKAIEQVIGHLKEDHCLSRNYYKGIMWDEINVMLAAAGFNFKRMMNKW